MSMVDLDLSFYFSGFKSKSKSVKAVVDGAKDTYGMEHSSMLGGQLFNMLYQKDPHLTTVDDPNNKYAQAVRAVLNSGQFMKLRNQTAGSLSWSAIGASILVDELAKKLYWQDEAKPETKEEPQPVCQFPSKPDDSSEDESDKGKGDDSDKEGEAEDKTESDKDSEGGDESESESDEHKPDDNAEPDESDNGSEQSDSTSDSGDTSDSNESKDNGDNDPSEEDGESDESDESDRDESSDDGNDKDEDSDDGTGDSGDETTEPTLDEQRYDPVSMDIQRAVNEAGEKLDNMMVGLSPGAGDSEETFTDAIDLAELYTGLAHNEGLSNLIELVGKLRLNTSFLPAMHVGEPEEVSEVELGDELEKVLPSDIGLMFGGDEENFDFMRRLQNAELIQYKTVTHKQPGMGPMVVCMDSSGSMTYQMSGSDHTRDEWAKSLAIAIYIQAMKENRPYALVNFATYANLIVPSQMNRIDAEFLTHLQSNYAGGGTDFGHAWDRAIQFITQDREGRDFRDADIVFITDGHGGYEYDAIVRSKLDNNIRLVTIFLGSTMDKAMRGDIARWAELSDAMAFVNKLSDKTEAEAFRIIKNHEVTGVRDI